MFAQSDALTNYSLKQPLLMNPLEKYLYLLQIDFTALTIENIDDYVQKIGQLHDDTYNEIAALSSTLEKITFKNTVQRIINLPIFIGKAKSLCEFSKYIHHDSAIRDASTKATQDISKKIIECEQREDVFLVLQHYEQHTYQKEASSLNAEEYEYVKGLMRDYKRSGLSITDNVIKERIKKIKIEISELGTQFEHNVNEDNTSFILSANELSGLPQDWFSKEKEVAPNQFRVTLKYDDYFPILDYATNRNIREKLFAAYHARCMDTNLDILKNILLLKNEMAQLLGYATHADFVAEVKMVKTAQNARAFLNEMNQRFTPLLDKNLEDLTAFAKEKENDPDFVLAIFDMRYYTRLREEKLFNINMEKIKEYFPTNRVIHGTLEIYEKLLGLKFVKNISAVTWLPEVSCYDVYDNQKKMGCFYLDLHPREGKYAHAAAFELQDPCDVSHLLNERQTAMVAMVCNFPKEGNLPFSEVETFFHEFGHVMHFICGENKLAENNSFKVENDFVEAPSQMLENWCYEPAALSILSAHERTGEPLPYEIAEKLKMKNQLHAGFTYKRQLLYGMLDYSLHCMSEQELKQLDLNAHTDQLHSTILRLPNLPGTALLASFGHLVGDYDAGYYGYLYSEICASDMYQTIFKENPLSEEAGLKYRRCILAPGASQEADTMIHNLLGRKPQMDAFLERCGLNTLQKRKADNIEPEQQLQTETYRR